MKKNGKVLLSASVTVDEVYKVVSQLKDSCRFCLHEGGSPDRLQLQDKNCIFSWKINSDENKENIAEFYFYEKKRKGELELKISFHMKTIKESKGEVHLLTYAFSENGYENQIFRLFNDLGNLIPKCYKKTQIKNEQWLIDDPKRNFYISFNKDLNEEMPVPESWINRMAEDLYFLDATIIKASKKKFSEYTKKETRKEIKKEAGSLTENPFYKEQIIWNKAHHMEELIDKEVKPGFEISMKEEKDVTYIFEEDEYKEHLKTYEDFRNFVCEKYLSLNPNAEKIIEKPNYINSEDYILNNEFKNQIKENQHKELEIENKLLEKNVKELKQQVLDLNNQKDSDLKKIKTLETQIQEAAGQKKVDADVEESVSALEIEKLKKELNEKNAKISRLENQLDEMKNSKLKIQNQTGSKGKTLFIPCTEENLFPDEIEDFLYSIIYGTMEKKMKKFPHNEEKEVIRKKDVIKNILDNKVFDYVKSESGRKRSHVYEGVKNRNPDYQSLKSEGFKILRESGEHVVTYFYNERYEMVFASTSSDEKRGGKNKYQDIEKRLFL